MAGKWFVSVVALGLVGAAACSSGGASHASNPITNTSPASRSHETPTTSSAARTTSTTAPHSAADDTATARAAQLAVADLPGGWSSRPITGAGDTSSRQVADCLGVGLSLVNTDLVPHDDANFVGPNNGTVTAVVAVYPDASTAQHLIAAYSSAHARQCFRTFLTSVLAFTPDATPMSLGNIGDGRVGIRFVFNAGPAGTRTFDLLFARRGRVVCLLSVRLAPALDSAGLLTTMVKRVKST